MRNHGRAEELHICLTATFLKRTYVDFWGINLKNTVTTHYSQIHFVECSAHDKSTIGLCNLVYLGLSPDKTSSEHIAQTWCNGF